MNSVPQWNPTQRSFIIKNLIRFLEMRVIMDECSPTTSLLEPTPLIGEAWRALIIETHLYPKVIRAIQSFHHRPKRMIHHSVRRSADPAAYQKRLERTQALFSCYYDSQMPESLVEVDSASLTDASALTDFQMGLWSQSVALPYCRSTPPAVIENLDIDSTKGENEKKTGWNIFSRWTCFDIIKETFMNDNQSAGSVTALLQEQVSFEDDL